MGKEDSQRSANHPVTVTPHISSTHDLIQLPLPNTISHNNARSGASFAVRVTIGTLILLWTLFNIDVVTSPFRQNPSIDSLDDSSAAGYLRGIATKSMKWALPAPNHQLHSTYGDLESTEIGEEGIKMSLIPPKLAEKIFLDVPSNDSVAA